MKRYYQQLTRFSAAFAFMSDISLLVLGGSVKRREKTVGPAGRYPGSDVSDFLHPETL
jgi:hypothetical protein